MGIFDGRQVADEEQAWTWPEPPAVEASAPLPSPSSFGGGYDGNKFPGGLSSWLNETNELDYWALRYRSGKLFRTNTYARGLIRRLVTNIINTGLELEATPEETILGKPEDSLVDWAEDVENRFALWCRTPQVCDVKGYRGYGAIQRSIYSEALIDGDCLVVLRQHPAAKLPQVQVISGNRVQSPPLAELGERTVVDGVHIDANGRHLGYYIQKSTEDVLDGDYEYIPTHGPLTGRHQAWLVYGYDKREDGVRGEPLLGIAIQPLNEIDRFRDSAQRKAYAHSINVGYVSREQGPGTLPMTGGALRKDQATGDPTGETPPLNLAEVLPGYFMERLQPGEKPVLFASSGADVNFGAFEASIIHGLAWAMEIPPSVLTLGFHKSYSANQGEVKEFKMLIDKEQQRFGSENNDHVYAEWFLSSVLLGKIEAVGYVDAVVDPTMTDISQAWTQASWPGVVKPHVDPVKQTAGYAAMCKEGFDTRTRAARDLTGTDYRKNVRRLAKENEQLIKAITPILEAEREYGAPAVASAMARFRGMTAAILDEEDTADDVADDIIRS